MFKPSALPPTFRRDSRFALLVLLLFLECLGWAVAAPAAAPEDKKHEKPYALIFGTVWGPDDRPLYGVKVKIRRAQDKKARWELYSDHRGEFAQRVPAGQADYVVWADVKGYKLPNGKHLQGGTEVTVHIDNEERADTGLHLK
jgi:hypothetical protein